MILECSDNFFSPKCHLIMKIHCNTTLTVLKLLCSDLHDCALVINAHFHIMYILSLTYLLRHLNTWLKGYLKVDHSLIRVTNNSQNHASSWFFFLFYWERHHLTVFGVVISSSLIALPLKEMYLYPYIFSD